MIYKESIKSDEDWYDVVHGFKGLEFSYSKRVKGEWNCAGEVLGRLEDTGNGYKIKLGKKTLNLDYMQAHELAMMLGYAQKRVFHKCNLDKLEEF